MSRPICLSAFPSSRLRSTMASQTLIIVDDFETAVRANAPLDAVGFSTAMVSSPDGARGE